MKLLTSHILLAFLFTAVLFVGNAHAQTLSPVKGGHCFTLSVPTFLTKTYDLNDVASLQYQNTQRDAYLIVIYDEKGHLESVGVKFTDSKDFLDSFLADYMIDATNRKTTPAKVFQANGNGHAQSELTWSEDGANFFMLVTAVETKEHFYKILCWTSATNKDRLLNDFVALSKTLKE